MGKNRRSILMGGGNKTLLLGFALLVIALAVISCEQPNNNVADYITTADGTWEIYTADGLLAWNRYVTNEDNYVEYTDEDDYTNYVVKTSAKLMADISLEGISWTPVGYYDYDTDIEYYYAGTFDGGGHTISNLKIDSSNSFYGGLFGYIATGGVVKNLTLSDVEISGNNYIGGIAGRNNGTIENCSVSGSVSGTDEVGGIAGQNDGTISNCNNEGKVSGTEAESIGGIVGYNRGTIEYCDVESGSVSGASDVGGIVGYNGGTIKNCNVLSGSVSVSGSSHVGGIAGFNLETIENCSVSGSVLGIYEVGGIVGYNGGTISGCNNKGKVLGTEAEYVGGIAGSNYGTIENCSVSGSVSGIFDVGGIAGSNYGIIENCSVSGSVSGIFDVGGIVGANYGKITACYNIGEVSGTDHIGGIAGSNDYGLSEGIIISCYNTGTVSESSNIGGIGGIAGYNSRTITACYWSVPEGSSITSVGEERGTETTAIKVDGSVGNTWDDALSGMNKALGTESEYSYMKNNDSTTKETMPLVIVKKSSN